MALPKKKRNRGADVDLRQPDEFISFSARAFDYVNANRMPFIIGSVALVVVVGVVWGLKAWTEHEAAVQADAFSRAVDVLRTPVKSPEAEEPEEEKKEEPEGAKKDEGERFASAIERSQAAATELAEIEGRSGVAALARLGTATARLDMGEIDEALDDYDRFLASGAPPALRFFGLDGLTTALIEKGDLDGALARAKEIEALEGGTFADHGAWLTARILERKGDADGATKAYRTFLEKHPESLLKPSVEKRLALLGG